MNIGTRLRHARGLKQWSQEDLANASGVSQASISKIERGDQNSSVHTPQLAAALEVEAIWLASGKEPMKKNEHNMLRESSATPYRVTIETGRKIPILSWKQCFNWDIDLANCETITIDSSSSTPMYYAAQVQGDTMTNPYGQPSIPHGATIIVDREASPKNGDLVVVRLADQEEAIFKQLVIDGGEKYLKSLNPIYPLIPLKQKSTLLGVVKSYVVKLT
jgi:SOS-response transcriptional repressor LexA